ncbi:WD40 repeat-like protein [Paraphaeosphaeria sporulosa]|uniref:WD40 repeat-like protein n=1 Tax=Paraphaeosphaeria sporulosa TaxID=1460663 RepID=A0A177CVW1_9PLEO|nr:WD40 repeat-like protein [Paraphaeosphaeria sporulosa]OAG11168.1 WD40 repeat-like protein [Paraphaeosphaeria sporulosa]
MRLLQCSDSDGYHSMIALPGNEAVPPYAILSHTWGAEGDEVTFDDLINGTGTDKPGYDKIRFCADQARQDGLEYFWIDSCCINQEDKAELSKAINSMFRWYRNADRCYVYLSDVSTAKRKVNGDACEWEAAFRRSRWFTRGWTLQELLAPRVVEFFSRQRKRLGDMYSLKKHIHEITAIPEAALEGELLSQFSVNDRLSWIEHRETKREEDKAYSLLGIFGVYMPPIYGEGIGRAFSRLQDEIKKLEECTRDLYVTDPRRDKTRIEETKGGLLEESYNWIFQNPDFLYWRNDPQSRLLWIKGDPGKGKTMLLCGIINELRKSTVKTSLLSYFFCQATDLRINSATAVLRGLLFMLVSQQPSLISHLRKKYDQTGKAIFEDANAWVVLCEIFTDILQDSSLDNTYFLIDALDECVKDLEKLLAFLIQKSSLSPRVKWIVTSRNHTSIEQRLLLDNFGARLCLELKENTEQVSRAVSTYINHRLMELEQIQHDRALQLFVQEKMQQKANGTFLWVSLVMKELKDALVWEILQVLDEVPTELTDVYRRMMERIRQLKRRNPELCRRILSTVVVTYRPLHLQELYVLADLPNQGSSVEQTTTAMVNMCGSFLTIRGNHVYVIHQSARDFLLDGAGSSVFLSRAGEVHERILSRSMQIMSKDLQRDIYQLKALGYPIEQVQPPEPDPLVALRYLCVYWVDHLYEWSSTSSRYGSDVLQSGGPIDSFLREKYLYWLEALSLCKSVSKGVLSMAKLEALSNEVTAVSLTEIVQDARRFIMYHKSAIESSPLQVYASALLFSPTRSLVRNIFQNEELNGIVFKPAIGKEWSSCLLRLEGHSSYVNSVAFSHDSTRLASGSHDHTVRIWDASSGEHLLTLKGHSHFVSSVAFSHDSNRLASGSWDKTVKIWDAYSGECLLTFKGHSNIVLSVAFSHHSNRLASASQDGTMKVWNTYSGECLSTLKGHSDAVCSVAFSHDSNRLASASRDCTVKVWEAHSGECLLTLKSHSDVCSWVSSVALSHDSTRLASASWDKTVQVWDMHSGECLLTLEGHSSFVDSVAFSHNSTWLASTSYDRTIKVWDAYSGVCLSTLKGHSDAVCSVAFSCDSTRLASASWDKTVKVWDTNSGERSSTLEDYNDFIEGHSDHVTSVTFSHDSTRLASASDDSTVKVWDTSSCECLLTLEGHSGGIKSVAFSYDSTRLASASWDSSVKMWDASSGECLITLEGHRSCVSSVAFSQDLARLASASYDGTIKVWDAHSGECLSTIKNQSNFVESHNSLSENSSKFIESVAFSHDSKQVASASWENTVKVWDTISGELVSILKGHGGFVYLMAFSHDSNQLASASYDKTIKLWNISNGECLSTTKVENPLNRISFDSSDSHIYTDIGVMNISALPILTPTSTGTELEITQYRGVGLSADNAWITYNSENLLLLPAEYQPSHSAVSGDTIAMGFGKGGVWICEVQSDKF